MGELNVLDVVALSIVTVSTLMALFKGLSSELISITATVCGFLLAAYFFPDAAPMVTKLGIGQLVSELFAFIGIFLGCIVAGACLASILNRLLRTLRLKWIDRFLGGAFGLLRGWLIVAIIFLALTAFPVRNKLVSSSKTGEFFLTGAKVVLLMAPESFQKRFYTEYYRIYKFWMEKTGEKNL